MGSVRHGVGWGLAQGQRAREALLDDFRSRCLTLCQRPAGSSRWRGGVSLPLVWVCFGVFVVLCFVLGELFWYFALHGHTTYKNLVPPIIISGSGMAVLFIYFMCGRSYVDDVDGL